MVSLIPWMEVALLFKGSGLSRKQVPGTLFIPGRIQGLNAKAMEKVAHSSSSESSGFWGEVGKLASFFPRLGVGSFAAEDAWNLLPEANRRRLFPAGQSSRGGQCDGADRFSACMRLDRHACVRDTSVQDRKAASNASARRATTREAL